MSRTFILYGVSTPTLVFVTLTKTPVRKAKPQRKTQPSTATQREPRYGAAPQETSADSKIPRQTRLAGRSRCHEDRPASPIDSLSGSTTSTALSLRKQRNQTAFFDREFLVTGDLILTEVLQGFERERDFNDARRLLTSLEIVELGGAEIAIQAANNFRTLRRLGAPCTTTGTLSPSSNTSDSVLQAQQLNRFEKSRS